MNEDSVTWDDVYLVGLPAIDEQHKKLVVMIGDLFQLCQEGNTSTKLSIVRAFNGVSEYTQEHFRAEEELLAKHNYPELPEHKKEHAAFITEVWTQFEQYNKDAAAPIGLPRFLKKWLLNHIAVKDKRYAAFITKR